MPHKPKVASPAVVEYAETYKIDLATVAASCADGRITLDDVKAARPMPYVTPLVAKLADEHSIDLRAVQGTGIAGRIRKDDVLRAAGKLPPRASSVIDDDLRSAMDASIAAGAYARRQQAAARGPAYALNPLVDRVRAMAAANRASAPASAPPTLFAAGDCPSFTASGVPPQAVLEVPWQARHAMAAAPTAAEAYAIQTQCTGSDAETTAAMLFGEHPGNTDYADRVAQWQLSAMSDAQLYESLMPGSADEISRRQDAMPLDLPAGEAAAIDAQAAFRR